MAKTIKFNLICDEVPVRTLEDLRSHFSIEDVLAYYENKLLHRWLNVRGYVSELEQVEDIQETDDLAIIKRLLEIFEVEMDDTRTVQDTYILKYKKERAAFVADFQAYKDKMDQVVVDHQSKYHKLIQTILNNKENMAQIKACVQEIDEHYSDLFALNFREFFYTLYHRAPMAIFVMLTRNNMRARYLVVEIDSNKEEASNAAEDAVDEATLAVDRQLLEDKTAMYQAVSDLLAYDMLKLILGDNLKEFSGHTEDYWKDIEERGREYMILSMQGGNFVRSAGVSGGDKTSSDILRNFVILDGIDYKSNNNNHRLLYMEV